MLPVTAAASPCSWKGWCRHRLAGTRVSNHEEIKDFPLDVRAESPPGPCSRGWHSPLAPRTWTASSFPVSARRRGPSLAPAAAVEGQVAALVYADAGTEAGGKMEGAALELLVVTRAPGSKSRLSANKPRTKVPRRRALSRKPGRRLRRFRLRRRSPIPSQPTRLAISRGRTRAAAVEPVDAVSTMSKPVPASAAATATAVASTLLRPCRPKTRNCTARRNASPGRWSMKSSSTIKPRWPRAGRIRTYTIA